MKSKLLIIFTFLVQSLFATDYYCDPVNGSWGNAGTQESPWGSLSGLTNAFKSFKAGDVIFLKGGAHGEVYLSGTHTDYVTFKAVDGETPVIASIIIASGKYIALDGITFSADGSGGDFTRRYIFEAKNTASYLKITNCTIQSAPESGSWSKEDWYANAEDGLMIFSDNFIFNNNTVKNTYFAVEIVGSNVEFKNNLIDNFGADAIRALGDDALYEGNTIRDAYIEDYSVNHDDAIQMYDRYDVNNGVANNIIIRNNKIFSFADPVTQAMKNDNLVGYSMQGVIVTDGNMTNSVIENNLVVGDHFHGITLSGAVNCRVQNNTVVKNPQSNNINTNAIPWLQLITSKNGITTENSIVRNNLASVLSLGTMDATNTIETNTQVSVASVNNYFVDYSNFDFNLKETSPAVDAGTNTDASVLDINGLPRIVGGTVDVGAFEYQSGSSDVTPPVIDKIDDTNVNNTVVIVFDEVVTAESAENTANYILSNGVSVLDASLNADKISVTLTTGELQEDIEYTITANNVEDLYGNKSDNTSSTFQYFCYTITASSFQNDQWGYNPPENAFDGDLATKWSANGVGEWIQKEFCSGQTIKSVSLAFGFGDQRIYDFVVEVSDNGVDFTNVYTGKSSGSSTELELFDFEDVSGTYVRITGNGNNVADNNWNNFLEIVIEADDAVSVISETDNGRIMVYPNPVVNNELSIKGVVDGNIEIYSLSGHLVKAYKATNHLANLNLVKGVYLLKVNGMVKKVVVK